MKDFVKYDFHVHSIYSYDSLSPLKHVIKGAKKKGLNGLAITDHETIKGATIAKEFTTSNFDIIVGSEIKTDLGDVIGLFLSTEIKSRTFLDVVDEIRDQNGFVILPHPYKTFNNIPDDVVNSVDALEVLNGRINCELNKKARNYSTLKNIMVTGGSDAHLMRHIGQVYTSISADFFPLNIDNIFDALKTAEIQGSEYSRSAHYFSATIGNIRKKRFNTLAKLAYKEISSQFR
jgi:hypothetical protein